MYIHPSEQQIIQQIRLYRLSVHRGIFLTFGRELNHPKRFSCSPPLTRRRNSLIKPPQIAALYAVCPVRPKRVVIFMPLEESSKTSHCASFGTLGIPFPSTGKQI